jgi:hypothetical protein
MSAFSRKPVFVKFLIAPYKCKPLFIKFRMPTNGCKPSFVRFRINHCGWHPEKEKEQTGKPALYKMFKINA